MKSALFKRSLSVSFVFVAVSFFIFALGVFLSGEASGSAPIVQGEPPQLEWSLDVHLADQGVEAAGLGRELALGVPDNLLTKLNAEGVTTELFPVRRGSPELGVVLRVFARGSVDDFRRILFTVMMPEFNLLGGATEMFINSDTLESPDIELVLESNPSTGYGWHIVSDSDFIESVPREYQMHTRGYGVPQRQVLRLSVGASGGNSIKLSYQRLWENVSPARRITLKLSHLPVKLDLSDPTAPAEPLPEPKRFLDVSAFPTPPQKGLPASWDWRTQGIVTPIRDQGSCGSCWAFGTVGLMESSLWKNGVVNQDLSEQFLISCNTHGFSCNGGLTANMYHYDRIATNQTVAGAVLEADKPYTVSDGTCTQSYSHPHKLTGWQFIVPTEFDMPTVDQIKNAIYTYGPITAGVCAGTGWDTYTSGIFSTDETSQCGGNATNHQIVLVGWNDNGGVNGYWVLRNSWGTSWGIDGYMHITYNTSRVGEGTSWVTTPAGNTAPTLGTLTPSVVSGAVNAAQNFSGVYNDANGYGNLSTARLLINSSLTSANGIYVYYDRNANKLYMYNDAGTAAGSCTPSVTGTITNTQGTLNCGATTVTGSGNNLTVNWNITPKAAFTGTKNLYMYATDMAGATVGWVDKGNWTIAYSTAAPTLGTLTQSVVSTVVNFAQNFSAVYSDANGYADLNKVYLLANSSVASANGIYVYFDRIGNKFYMYDNAGTALSSCARGASATLTNSQGTLDCALTTVSASGNNLTVNWNITPKAAFAGTRNLYMYAADIAGASVGWIDKGDWTILLNAAPTLGTLTPSAMSSSANTAKTFNAVYSDANGYGNLSTARLLINSSVTSANGIYVYYDRNANKLYMYNDAGTAATSCTPSVTGTLTNTQGTLNCQATTVTGAGNNLTVNWNITPSPTFTGTRNLYLYATDSFGAKAGWVDKGDWTITAYNAPPMALGLTPWLVAGPPNAAQNFSALYHDGDGYANLSKVHLLINSSVTSVNGIYVYYDRNANKLYMYNDAGTAATSCTPSVAGTLTNTQGTLNCQATTVTGGGYSLTVNWNITPSPTFTGTKNLYMYATDIAGDKDGWWDSGDWTITSSNVAPALGTLTPSVVSGAVNVEQIISAVYMDANGYGNLSTARLLINSSLTSVNGIYVYYDRNANKLYMYNDAGTTASSCSLGDFETLTNTQGTLNCLTTTVTGTGNNLTVNWNITPRTAFVGTKNLYMYATDNFGAKVGWVDKGNGTIYTSFLLSEYFSSGLPGSWSIINGGSADTWTTANSCARTIGAPFSAPWAMIDSDCSGTGNTQEDHLITPSFDASACSEVILDFDNQFRSYSNESAQVFVWDNSGATWDNVLVLAGADDGYPTPNRKRIDISSIAAGQSDVKISWSYFDGAYDWWWAIDNVEVTCVP